MKQPIRNSSCSTTSKSTPCCIKIGLKRGSWTPEEDEILSKYIKKEGEGKWRTLPKKAGLLRCGKSCRLRWMNYLRPSLKRGQISPDEEDLILRLHRLLGNRWALIAGRIPGRTDNEIKNYWNTHLSKKLISEGIDPRTHKPLNPNPSSSSIVRPLSPTATPRFMQHGNHINVVCTKDETEQGKVYQEGGTPNLDRDRNWLSTNDLGLCNDDIFSSFLDSLANDDLLLNQQHKQTNVCPTYENGGSSSKGPFGNYVDLSSSSSATVDHEEDCYRENHI